MLWCSNTARKYKGNVESRLNVWGGNFDFFDGLFLKGKGLEIDKERAMYYYLKAGDHHD